MSIPVFDPGDKVFFTRTFTKATGQAGTPINVTVALSVADSVGALTAPAVAANTVAGVCTATASTTIPAANTAAGMWYARWTASVDIIAVEEECFYVRTSPVL